MSITPWCTCFGRYADPHKKGEQEEEPSKHGNYKDIRPGSPPYLTLPEYARLLNKLQEIALNTSLGIPLYFSADQEGDLCHDISNQGINLFPAYMGQSATGNPQIIYNVAKATARQLRAIGVHWLHSPVLDVNINPLNPEIGTRSFSDDPELVADYGILVIKAFKEENIVSTGKHFPGRGDSDKDAHYGLPVVAAPRKRLNKIEIYPFKKAVEVGISAIMTGHTIYPALDPERPASLSKKIITDLLRNELGFNGVITSDSITMGAIMEKYGTPDASAMAIQAGSDVILMKEETILREKCIDKVVEYVRDGKIPEKQLDQSVARVLGMKYDYGLFEENAFANPEKVLNVIRDPWITNLSKTVAQKSQVLLRDKQNLIPLSLDKMIMVIEQVFPPQRRANDIYYHPYMLYESMLKYSKNVMGVDIDPCPTERDIKRIYAKIDSADIIVITCGVERTSLGSRELVKRLIKEGKKVIVVTNSPYPAGVPEEAKTVLVTFSFNNRGLETAADILFGNSKAEGRLSMIKKLS